MIAYVTETFRKAPVNNPNLDDTETWLRDFRHLVASLQITSESVTSLLSMASSAISTGRPLPPYLKTEKPFHLGEVLESLDTDILSIRHVTEPGYAAFAVMQVATTMINEDLAGLLAETKKLVGEVDFNVNVVRMEDLEGDVDPIEAVEKRG